MWFDDEEVSRRRLFAKMRKARRRPILKVNGRLRMQKKTKMHRVAVFVLVPVIVVGAVVLVYFSGGLAKIAKNRRMMLAKNKEELDRIRLEGARKSAEKFIEGVNEGLNG